MNLAIESKNARKRVKVENKEAKLKELKELIAKETGISTEIQKILVGFPPKEIDGDEETLTKLGVRSGDKITVQEKESVNSNNKNETPKLWVPDHDKTGVVVRRVVDADNSCLFNCIGYCFEGKTRSKSQQLRNLVVETIKSDSLTYSEAFLGKDNKSYCNWIILKDAWGGAVELSIFAQHYKTEIAVFDIQTKKIYLYGEQCGYNQKVFLIYDGIHYDPLALAKNENAKESEDITLFKTDDDFVEKQGNEMTKKLHEAHKFVDTSKFQLRCLVCGKGLAGEDSAMEHAKETKHTNFAEYN